MPFQDFASNKKNCFTSGDGLLIWHVTGSSAPFPCTLGAGGIAVSVHVFVGRGRLDFVADGRKYSAATYDFARFVGLKDITLSAVAPDTEAFLLVSTDAYNAALFVRVPDPPLTFVTESRCVPVEHLDETAALLLYRRLTAIYAACRDTQHSFRDGMISCAARMFLLDVVDLHLKKPGGRLLPEGRQKEILTAFMQMIHDGLSAKTSVTELAARFCVTPQYFNRIVHAWTGKTVHTWICFSLVNEITRRLETTDESMQQIARDLSFPDQSALAKFYKRNTGSTLTGHRRSACLK